MPATGLPAASTRHSGIGELVVDAESVRLLKQKRPFAEAKGRHITVTQPVRCFPPAGAGVQAATVRTTCKNTVLFDIVINQDEVRYRH
ncbi:MAG: hypothetical protein DRP66_03440 [Planctomycetota bacterium]|nr:MAG: hypothetical protein DRP66_03440 [Planctomycetota bacterium]